MRNELIEGIKKHQIEIHRWLKNYEGSKELPLYSSVDIRDAGFKMAVVDTNLFPAGFNNLCEHGLSDAVKFIREAILRRVEHCQDILIVAEEHTRNTWYLENVRILQQIIEQAGFRTKTATFLYIQPGFCEDVHFVELKTATDQPIQIYCFKNILNDIKENKEHFDLILLNNDLISGIPQTLKDSDIPIYPSIQAGWHSRLKSVHFKHTADLVVEFCQILGLDPWYFSCLNSVVDHVDIHQPADRVRLMDTASELFKRIRGKYREHGIPEKPFIFVKADAGTYGMGVKAVEDPQEILELNRKDRNKLHKGKGAHVIDRYLFQEGVATIYSIDQRACEVVIYQIANNLVGGFYRSHATKSSRDNLNTQGMEIKKMCPHLRTYGDEGLHPDVNLFDVYRILARIAGIAAHREIVDLEMAKK